MTQIREDLLKRLGDQDNSGHLDDLVHAVRDIGVTLFVGAGMSRPLEFPLWKEFLDILAKDTRSPEIEQRVSKMIGNGECVGNSGTTRSKALGTADVDWGRSESWRR